jgi:hypothetical protein
MPRRMRGVDPAFRIGDLHRAVGEELGVPSGGVEHVVVATAEQRQVARAS